jgi:LacI family transcriptional regulator
MLDRLIDGLECDSVTVDNYQSVFDAISIGIRMGHRKIGYIRGRELYTDIVRLEGYKAALNFNGIEVRDDYIVISELVEHDATRQFMHLMNLPDPPTLIFCSNVYHTMGAFEAMLEYDLKIPEDVSVIVFDRLSAFPYMGFTESIKPQFASISQPIEEIGSCTAELLLERLENGMDHYEPKSVKLKTSFSMTESVSNLT